MGKIITLSALTRVLTQEGDFASGLKSLEAAEALLMTKFGNKSVWKTLPFCVEEQICIGCKENMKRPKSYINKPSI